MRHTEVAKSPGHCGYDRQESVVGSCISRHIVAAEKIKITRKGVRVFHDRVKPACLADPEEYDDDQSDRHENTLDQVCRGNGKETAERRIPDDDDSTYDHGGVIIKAEQTVEKRSDRLEARCSIRYKENDDDQRRDACKRMALVAVPSRKEIRNRKCPDLVGVSAKQSRDQQPVEVCSDSETDCSPADLRNTGEVSQSRKTHEQITAHIRSFRTHRRDERSELSSADEELARAAAGSAAVEQHSDQDHGNQIDHDDCQDHSLCRCHNNSPPP